MPGFQKTPKLFDYQLRLNRFDNNYSIPGFRNMSNSLDI